MSGKIIFPEAKSTDDVLKNKVNNFISNFSVFEIAKKASLVLYFDKKSQAYYLICHLTGSELVEKVDLEATLDSSEDEGIYKLNRDLTEDKAAYKVMESDARSGRSFEDLVLEYDTEYRPDTPLKVYGGQHRIKAIQESGKTKKSTIHGVRVYFNLSKSQKVEIATVNNTSIAVPNDLLDRMEEQLLGPELRNWCQKAGLLEKGEDFADKRDPKSPTVRIARTLIVNFYKGKASKTDMFHQPVLCKSGKSDKDYANIRDNIEWNDHALLEMGKQFSILHTKQRSAILKKEGSSTEFARKALSYSVVASWAYASGLYQKDTDLLQKHYSLPNRVAETTDPLNAKVLSEARHKTIDPDTYRGLGTRSDANELGRMFEVFHLLTTKTPEKGITKKLAEAAIKSYEAKKASNVANLAMKNL